MAVSAMKAGAVEFLPKPFREQQLIDAVADAMRRSTEVEEDTRIRNAYLQEIGLLSLKEREILDDLSSGLQINEIAGTRSLSTSTIRVHRRNMRSKIPPGNFNRLLILHNRYRTNA
jgi:FixJ family two-component response regulator